jgi:GNAT superfamily N-acetyltransferase
MENWDVEVCRPEACGAADIAAFARLVRMGSEVDAAGLEARIKRAHSLAFIKRRDRVDGIAALKRPDAGYRARVQKGSRVDLSAALFPYELGWVYVVPSARGHGASVALTNRLLEKSQAQGVFATARSENVPIHRALMRAGFAAAGQAYKSSRGVYSLQVFLWAAGK